MPVAKLSSANAPAILRALADVIEQHDCSSVRLQSWQHRSHTELEVALRAALDDRSLRLALADAYKRHGGAPCRLFADLDPDAPVQQLEVPS
jgi:hypothetical protein